MKKIMLAFSMVFFLFFLTSCNKIKEGNLVFTELITSNNLTAVEIYNTTEETLDLTKVSLNIYSNGNLAIDYEINLEGELKPKGLYVVVLGTSHTDENIKNKADLFSENLNFNGNDALTIASNGKIISTYGIIGSSINYGQNSNMVKKTEYLNEINYEEYYFLRYENDINFLKTLEYSLTAEEIIFGPKLSTLDYEKTFISQTDINNGAGGVVTVVLEGCGDGDTANFRFPKDLLGISSVERVRFMNIDTRETGGAVGIQEWGWPAKVYTCDRLKAAKKIEIKSEANFPLREGYGRLWGWIFVDGQLLNHQIVQKGYSDVGVDEKIKSSSKNMTYNSYLLDAYYYAKFNKLGLFGEKDPYWDYQNQKPKN